LAKKKEINPDIIDLVKRMIQINPAKRPSINEVIEHPAFREVKL
jgi:serine/threonine protein kinase